MYVLKPTKIIATSILPGDDVLHQVVEIHLQVGVAVILVQGEGAGVGLVCLLETELLFEPVGHAVGVGILDLRHLLVVGGVHRPAVLPGGVLDVGLGVDEALRGTVAGGRVAALIGGSAVLRLLRDARVDAVKQGDIPHAMIPSRAKLAPA